MEKIRIPHATKAGFLEVSPGMVFDGSYPSSKTRRGRVQGGGAICPTLCAGSPEIYYYEGVYETDSDR